MSETSFRQDLAFNERLIGRCARGAVSSDFGGFLNMGLTRVVVRLVVVSEASFRQILAVF